MRPAAPVGAALLVAILGASSAGCYASHGIEDDAGIVSSSVTMPCTGGASGSRRDCGFRLERVETCSPGRSVTVGCGCEGLGSCTGDPVLRLCAGAAACRVDDALENVDDRCGLCPAASIPCPPEGRFTILSAQPLHLHRGRAVSRRGGPSTTVLRRWPGVVVGPRASA